MRADRRVRVGLACIFFPPPLTRPCLPLPLVTGVRSLALSPDETMLYSGGADKGIRAWDVECLSQQRVFAGHAQWIRHVETRRGWLDLVVSSSNDCTARVWDPRMSEASLVMRQHGGPVLVSCFLQHAEASSGIAKATVAAW